MVTGREDDAVLALDGGAPVRSTPFPGWPTFDERDIAEVASVLAGGRVNYWTGEHGRSFETQFAQWSGARHAVAVANGTLALELALAALGLGPGDDVIVPAATFIATASAVVRTGGAPVVADVDLETGCLTAQTIRAALTPRTRAVVVVHLGGVPAVMEPIVALAHEHGLRVVEDCAQAHGATRDGRMVGGLGDIAAWSFCQDKIMTTAGEGGAVTTDDDELFEAVWSAKDHGKNRVAGLDRSGPGGFRWLHDSFGTNARMTELQAVVGRNQLAKIDGWLALRRDHAATIRAALSDQPALEIPRVAPEASPAWYRCYLRLRLDELVPGWDRDRVVRAIAAEGVPCQQGSCFEIHRERAFRDLGPPRPLPNAALLGRSAFALLVHPTLAGTDVDDMIAAVRKVLRVAVRERGGTARMRIA